MIFTMMMMTMMINLINDDDVSHQTHTKQLDWPDDLHNDDDDDDFEY